MASRRNKLESRLFVRESSSTRSGHCHFRWQWGGNPASFSDREAAYRGAQAQEPGDQKGGMVAAGQVKDFSARIGAHRRADLVRKRDEAEYSADIFLAEEISGQGGGRRNRG